MSDAIVNVTGSYNTNSQPQLTAINLSISFIHQAIDALHIYNSFLSNALIIADFCTSPGANSVYSIKLIINYLCEKNKLYREPVIIHNDLPTNDWKKVFQLLIDDNSYKAEVSGHSFYEQCLPDNSLSIGYSSTSIHWLSKKPCNISNHCVALFATGDELIAFQSQVRMDYMSFLENRSHELIPGDILILALPSLNGQEQCGKQNAKDLLYKCAEAELRNNPINFYEQLEIGEITLGKFAQSRSEFIRSWCEPILKTALEINEQHSKELVNRNLIQYWIIYQSKIKEKTDEYNYLNNTYLILKKN
ncbi:unnamed protein product [Rotaria magnacalcarata]|uniref:SAM-dependent methyltransferase n=5 Tax=Rotaria magnacalcarata TaxID=392030 RepID=A0A8S2RG25_9BILA|nr:unnamed protein product [Rotaria magnacalcarata]CAF5102335.1 unnamed protein product [Rotaria magnacalcarata]